MNFLTLGTSGQSLSPKTTPLGFAATSAGGSSFAGSLLDALSAAQGSPAAEPTTGETGAPVAQQDGAKYPGAASQPAFDRPATAAPQPPMRPDVPDAAQHPTPCQDAPALLHVVGQAQAKAPGGEAPESAFDATILEASQWSPRHDGAHVTREKPSSDNEPAQLNGQRPHNEPAVETVIPAVFAPALAGGVTGVQQPVPLPQDTAAPEPVAQLPKPLLTPVEPSATAPTAPASAPVVLPEPSREAARAAAAPTTQGPDQSPRPAGSPVTSTVLSEAPANVSPHVQAPNNAPVAQPAAAVPAQSLTAAPMPAAAPTLVIASPQSPQQHAPTAGQDAPIADGSPAAAAPAISAATPPPPAPHASAPTPAAAPTLPPAAKQEFTKQIAQPVFTLAAAGPGEHTMVVRVSPDALGPVTVQARIHGGDVRIELFAPNDGGREAIRQILPDLRRDAAASGLQLNLNLASGDHPGQGSQRDADFGRQGMNRREATPNQEPTFNRKLEIDDHPRARSFGGARPGLDVMA